MKAKAKTKLDLLTEVKELRRLLDKAEQRRREEILNEAELSHLASFPQLNPNPVVEVDPAGQVHYSNPAADQLFPDLGKAGLSHPLLVDLQNVRETKEISSRSPYVREVRIGNCWYLQTIHSVLDGTRLRIYAFDISELKRIQGALHEERDRLAALVRSIPDEIWFADAAGRFTLVNPPGIQEFNLEAGATTDVRQLAASLEVLRTDGTVRPIEESPPLRALRGETVTKQEEWVRTPATGELRYRQVSAAPVRDGSVNIVGSVSVVRDVTELKRAEKTIRESEERLRRIIETSPVAIGFGDSTGRIFEANEAFYRLTGYTREEIRARQLGWDRLTAPEYAEIDRQIMTTLAAAGSAGPYEKEYIRKDGGRVPLLLSLSKFPERDEHIAFIVDITEGKRNEEYLKKSKERFELLADTASKLLATQNPQGIVNELCQKVMPHLDCHTFFNYLVDPIGQRLHLNGWAGIPEQTAKEIEWLDYGVDVCGCAARDASRIVCENIPVTPDPRTELVKSFGIKAYACHPLFSEGRVIGTLSFGTRSRTSFREEELSFMKTVADQVATAMERIRLLREIEKAKEELERRVLERTEELRNANEKLKDERKLFYDVLETLPAYVVLLTPDYHATFANRTFIQRFGESQGRRCFEFLFERSEPCETCETYTALKTMAPHQWEWVGPDGRVYFVHDFPFTDVDGSTLILEMGIDITELKRAEEELRNKEHQIRFFASQYLTAQEKERRRIAAELHDSIASALAGIKFRIEKTGEDMKRGLGDVKSMQDLSTNLSQTIGEVRRIMTDLRPSILDDLGILPALTWLCREFEATYSRFSVEKQIGIPEERVPEALKIVIFRISQEAINNIAKHSDASRVLLSLQKAEEMLELTIQDNGHGFRPDEIAKGLGLSTMRERAELSGGVFSIQSSAGKGTLISVSWPLAQ